MAPLWSKHLEYVTFFEQEQVKDCFDALTKVRQITESPAVARIIGPAESAPAEKVLELNQNIFNQLPSVQPTTTKAAAEGTGKGFGKAQAREENFNIKAKREQIENIKRTIKDKLISLNNKSKSIESLLEDDVPVTRNTAFKSYRGAYTKNAAHLLEKIEADIGHSLAGQQSNGCKDKNRSELLSAAGPERQGHKSNCSSIEAAALVEKEKENKEEYAKGAKTAQKLALGHAIRESVGPADPLVLLLQKTMRI